MSDFQQPGGFLPMSSGLLSPPPSSIASTSLSGHTLPTPRTHALKAGSPKETAFINHVDKGIQEVSRKFALKRGSEEGFDGGNRGGVGADGFQSFAQAARDIERLIDVVWVSGTPTLQIPYLLSLALLATTYIPAFLPAPQSLFRLLDKLDYAFASLLLRSDVQTGDPLPGFEGNRRKGVNGTEKVRIKSLVERTRVVVVEVFTGSEEFEDEEEETGGEETEMDTDVEVIDQGWSVGRDWEMDVARVYVRTLGELGDELIGPSIGIPDT